MNDRLSAKLNMYVQVKVIADKYKTVWEGNPAFSRAEGIVSKSAPAPWSLAHKPRRKAAETLFGHFLSFEWNC